ncbi:aromatic amino acid lyase (plasmid) [Pseudoalteromonas espejiana]
MAGRLTIEDIISVVKDKRGSCAFCDSHLQKIDSAVAFLDKLLAEEGHIYGVSTGYGDSCTVEILYHLLMSCQYTPNTFSWLWLR